MEELYFNYYQDIFHFVLSIVQDEDAAQDITQDTFMRAYENKHILKQENKEKTKSWLLTVARNLCIDRGRKIQSENAKLMRIHTIANSLESTTFTDTDPSHHLQSKELEKVINKAMELIKDDYRQAITLYELKQLTYKESADKLGMTVPAFTSLLQRARKSLFNQIIKIVVPNFKNEVLTDREIKQIFSWFHILDIPVHLEKEIASISSNFFDRMNNKYEDIKNETYPEGYDDYLLSSVPLNKEDTVIDIGCGTGDLSIELSSYVKEVHAVDHSQGMLNILEDKMKRSRIENIKPLCMSFTSTYKNIKKMYHVAFCSMVLHHLYHPKGALEKLAKAILPGGHLVVADLTYTDQNWKFKNEHDLWSGFKLEQMRSWLENAGFKLVHLEENHAYRFKFYDVENEKNRIEVPLLYAHCIKKDVEK